MTGGISSGVLTVTAISPSTSVAGIFPTTMIDAANGVALPAGIVVTSNGTGSGGIGTYNISNSTITVASGSTIMGFTPSNAGVANIPNMIASGNSIVQGTGASTGANCFVAQIGTLLQQYLNLTSTHWTIANYGVGGTTTANNAGYFAFNNDNTDRTPTRNSIFGTVSSITPPNVVIMMTLRNDISQDLNGTLSRNDAADLLRAQLNTLKKQNVDVIFITDPPQINITTGALLDGTAPGSTWMNHYQDALRICSEEGASVVDVWAYFINLMNQGISLINYNSDGTHPNDAGHLLIAQLAFLCITSPSQYAQTSFYDHAATLGKCLLVSAFNNPTPAFGVTAATTVAGSPLGPTARQIVRNAGGTINAFQLGTPNKGMCFQSPMGAKGVIVTYLQDPTSTVGSFTISQRGTLLYPSGNPTTTSVSTAGSFFREYSTYFPIPANGATTDMSNNTLQISNTASSGSSEIYIQNVVFVIPEITSVHDYTFAGAVEVGTWSDATATANATAALPCGYATGTVRSSSSVGDTVTFKWYGTDLTCAIEEGTGNGMISAVTDGGSAVVADCYSAGATTPTLFGTSSPLARGLTNGFHTTVITIATKNPSSSANLVKIGYYRASTWLPDPSSKYVTAVVGETIQIPQYFGSVSIDKVISGSPALSSFVPGQATISITGSGSAVIKLNVESKSQPSWNGF